MGPENEGKVLGEMRTFDTGATRGADTGKLDYEGFLCPFVLERYAKYLHEHRIQADGHPRAADNWQKGIPRREYIKSLIRHLIDLWKTWRASWDSDKKTQQDLVCAILFNAMGFLHVDLKEGRSALADMKAPTSHVQFLRSGEAVLDPEVKGCGGSGR